jgi:hypothetical protein
MSLKTVKTEGMETANVSYRKKLEIANDMEGIPTKGDKTTTTRHRRPKNKKRQEMANQGGCMSNCQ